jgi:serine/threonine-protein kinase
MATQRRIAGRYEALETLRSDERGEELRAHDRTLGREVLLVRRSARSPLLGQGAAERALREARAMASLHHPGIQKLHDVLEDEAGPMLVLEPVPGETLAERLGREGRLGPAETRALGIALADALAAVHLAGAVHRDVSEENVVLRADGSPCLAGFRLAKPAALGGTTSLEYRSSASSEPGASLLLPRHPAPEQLGGEAASARTDLFALGCVLYRALTGRPALPQILERGWSAPADPKRLAPGTPPGLAKLILACLARSPIGRPQSALELRERLAALAASARGPERRRVRTAWIGAAAAVFLALAGWRFWPRPEVASQERGLAAGNARVSRTAAYGPGFGKARALLIGIGEEYPRNGFPPLANAEGDARAVAEALERLPADRWGTTLLLGPAATHDGIVEALAALQSKLEPEDRGLVYFAGHGMPHESSESSGWILPSDAQTLERDLARKRWLHLDHFARFLDHTRAKHVLIAMDCCYGGRLAALRSAGARAFEASFLTTRARVVLTSGRSNEEVQDSGPEREHSPFAEVFLQELRPRRGGITTSSLHSRMLERFHERGVPHLPLLHRVEGDEGEFVFLLGE